MYQHFKRHQYLAELTFVWWDRNKLHGVVYYNGKLVRGIEGDEVDRYVAGLCRGGAVVITEDYMARDPGPYQAPAALRDFRPFIVREGESGRKRAA